MFEIEKGFEFASKQHIRLLHQVEVIQWQFTFHSHQVVLVRSGQIDNAERALAQKLKCTVAYRFFVQCLVHSSLKEEFAFKKNL